MHVIRLVLCCLAVLLLTGCSSGAVKKVLVFKGSQTPKTGIEVHGVLKFRDQRHHGERLSELSGLAWDQDESILYAVSDEGIVFHIRPVIRRGRLVNADILQAYPLLDAMGQRLSGKYSDSEDLALVAGNNGVRGDSQLVISFEGRPRVAYYQPNGVFIKRVELPSSLLNRDHYQSKNKALESVAYHPQYGVLTTPEYPLRSVAEDRVVFYSEHGKHWTTDRSNIKNISVVAMDIVSSDRLVFLQRAYQSALHPLIIKISTIQLGDACGVDTTALCELKEVSHLSSADGWSLDNFEGIAHHQNNHFFMVSDNNGSALQRTLLVYFQIIADQ